MLRCASYELQDASVTCCCRAVRQRVERALGGGVGSMEEMQQRLLAP